MNHLLFFIFLISLIPSTTSLQCYSGSQLQVNDCPSISCIKQTLGMDTVRYCDGSGVSSVCQTYRIFETCDTIPNLGYICCCSGNLCNSSISFAFSITLLIPLILFFLRL